MRACTTNPEKNDCDGDCLDCRCDAKDMNAIIQNTSLTHMPNVPATLHGESHVQASCHSFVLLQTIGADVS